MSNAARTSPTIWTTKTLATLLLVPVSAGCFSTLYSAETNENALATGRVDRYTYEVKHQVRWQSLDDDLQFETQQLWSLSLARSPGGIAARVLSIRAVHKGPNREQRIVVPAPAGESGLTQQSPLLGPLAAWVDVPISLTTDENGRITGIDGEPLREAWKKQLPAGTRIPDAPQLADSALLQWWQETFLIPPTGEAAAEEPLPLPAPLSGTVVRTWNGPTYSLAPPKGQTELQVTLYEQPTPVIMTVKDLEGSGTVTIDQGLLDERQGELTWKLVGTALTQPVEQQHRIIWRLKRTPIEQLGGAEEALNTEPGRRGR